MKAIKDAVHDHIEVDGLGMDLIDTPMVQRLRHIRQLGTAYLVYPSANHSRFEHTLGVYHLASKALDNLGIDGLERKNVLAAAILHDVGHSPFSHNIEDVIEKHTGKRHDDVEDLIEDGVEEVLKSHGISPGDVTDLIKGRGKLGQIISGELDVDRMDYLVRDAHHTGVPYGTIDSERLVMELEFVDDQLVLGEGNVQTAEALLIARALMHPTVYNHHVGRISKAMLKRATDRLIRSGFDPDRIRRMDDHDFIAELRQNPETRDTGERLSERDLFKRALWEAPESAVSDIYEIDEREVEGEIADTVGINRNEVIVDTQMPPKMTEKSQRVMVDGEIRRLEKVSSLVSSLEKTQKEQWRIGVYCPREFVGDVESAARSLILE